MRVGACNGFAYHLVKLALLVIFAYHLVKLALLVMVIGIRLIPIRFLQVAKPSFYLEY